jgi:hypothetical protein
MQEQVIHLGHLLERLEAPVASSARCPHRSRTLAGCGALCIMENELGNASPFRFLGLLIHNGPERLQRALGVLLLES